MINCSSHLHLCFCLEKRQNYLARSLVCVLLRPPHILFAMCCAFTRQMTKTFSRISHAYSQAWSCAMLLVVVVGRDSYYLVFKRNSWLTCSQCESTWVLVPYVRCYCTLWHAVSCRGRMSPSRPVANGMQIGVHKRWSTRDKSQRNGISMVFKNWKPNEE